MVGPPMALTRDGAAVDRTLADLRARILRGELAPGEQLRQEHLAGQVGVSRIPLREALRALAVQGLLVHRPHQGYFVAKRTPSELGQLHLMQGLLERELTQTIQWPAPDLLDGLQAMNAEMRLLVDAADWLRIVALNRAFHLTIFGLSPMRLVLQEVERLWLLAEPYQAMSLADPEVRRRTVDQHDAMIAALAEQDMAASLAALETHRASTHQGVARLLLPDDRRATDVARKMR
jgi:DNA-binding GntR family transcriptional regulator